LRNAPRIEKEREREKELTAEIEKRTSKSNEGV
jgi:hypothetical protein